MFYRTFNKNSIYYKLRIYLPIGHFIKIYEFTEEELLNFHKTIGTNVKRLRKEKKVTQLQLALAIGHIAKAELCKYGKHFNLDQLYKIAKILDVTIHDLIT